MCSYDFVGQEKFSILVSWPPSDLNFFRGLEVGCKIGFGAETWHQEVKTKTKS